MNGVNSLSHTSWNCKYHIVFAPQYRRKVFYGQKRMEIGEILRTLCKRILCGYSRENDKKIAEYIRRQLEEDQAGEQLTMGNF